MIRPSFEEIYMQMAIGLSERSTCRRLQVGCVITSADFRYVYAVGYNGNASGLPNDCDSEVPGQCLPEGSLVTASGVTAAYRRLYSGEIIRIITALGEFSVTPNHPVLTRNRGWIPAQLLTKGDHLFHPVRGKSVSPTAPYDYEDVPIEDVFEASSLARFAVRNSVAGFEFHGDCSLNERVEVVSTGHVLGFGLQPRLLQGVDQPTLSRTFMAEGVGSGGGTLLEALGSGNSSTPFLRSEACVEELQRFPLTAESYTSLCQTPLNDILGHTKGFSEGHYTLTGSVTANDLFGGKFQHGVAFVPAEVLGVLSKDTSSPKAHLDRGMGHTKAARDLQNSLSGLVTSDEILHIERNNWTGHVYNLSTESNWFCAGRSRQIVHNCGDLHAEENACINCCASRTAPKVVFCSNLPCKMCAKRLINLGGVERVFYKHDYRIRDSVEIFKKAKIILTSMTDFLEEKPMLDAITAWHTKDDYRGVQLHEALKLSHEDYGRWVETNELPEGYVPPVL